MAPPGEPQTATRSPTHLPLEIWFIIISFIKWQDRPDAWFTLRLICRTSRIAIEDVCARAYLPYMALSRRMEGSIPKNAILKLHSMEWLCHFDGFSSDDLARFTVCVTQCRELHAIHFGECGSATAWTYEMLQRFWELCERLKFGYHRGGPGLSSSCGEKFQGRRGFDIAGLPDHVTALSQESLGRAVRSADGLLLPWKSLLSKIFTSSIRQYKGRLWWYSDCEKYKTILALTPDMLETEGWKEACTGKRAALSHPAQRALDEERRRRDREWAGDNPYRHWHLRHGPYH
ncbi:hypothetical protein GE09DRAFT_1220210 [Coniochaeta sp. 2T2.1]|nr:hypothetical protein GE09DRAFT_1220210 [Coniochaeta sp. 2T2.1]